MTIYSEDELWFPNNIICTSLSSKEIKYPLKRQLWIAALKREVIDFNRPLSFEPLYPVPKRLLNIWRPETKLRIKNVTDWIYFKLWTKIGDISYQTMNVRISIASNMLEKLYLDGIITKDEFTYLYNNLGYNVRTLWKNVLEEDLPF